uniref:Uncharacterized protein n=1 Tax=Anguilla anguilla TaxID=7936 RepID=A0A0E9PTS5_ANGAN
MIVLFFLVCFFRPVTFLHFAFPFKMSDKIIHYICTTSPLCVFG